MDPTEPLYCEQCGNGDDDSGPDEGPEYCHCCDDILCERCWTASHVLLMR
jgi:hypothetical protein